ncbi:Agmatine/peptidylarginine deiminase [Hymenobacter daecheongensis DSM 21074]|uniref:Agmatine/peptidylarginine deiminase n=1 Tax=Hymenobacter daecheongensis DSM 21074 TaxID=1121955 RepID=A0A1M6L6Q2_9BACT|nr:agmatine deiminase family protein [Hymenobacter daecheongensis]SHJ66870.1 Agmatine/peptidylarginine deiminase [Hymenobacter daecheongensis DSM 21074]
MSDATKAGMVYLADILPGRHTSVVRELVAALSASGLSSRLLPGTRDIWARDYMPVPVPSGQLVRFRYAPDYLRAKKWQHLITNATSVCQELSLAAQESTLTIDGGNVVRGAGKVLLTDKVVRENPQISPSRLRRELARQLETDHLILLPADPVDFTGHADGMLHFLDERTVLLNDYSQEKTAFWPQLRSALYAAGLDWIPLAYNPYHNVSLTDAAGIYINFLRTKHTIVAPVFGQHEDEAALRQLERVFPTHTIQPIQCRELAREGGLLHCITWTAECE